MAEYRRGTGPNALPYGGAGDVNQATPPTEDVAGTPLDAGAEVPVQFAPGEADDNIPDDDNGLDEDTQVLLDHPNPDYQASMFPKDRAGRVPRYVVRHLPELMAAVRDPNAPPALLALYRAIIRQLEAEQRRGG